MLSNGFSYSVVLTYAFSRYTWLYFLKKKSDVAVVFPQFLAQAERVLGCKLKVLQTDGGGEFQALKGFLAQRGIGHKLTRPHTSEQDGLVERKHRQILECGLSMLAHASLQLAYWNEAFCNAVYLINRLPSSTLGVKSPHEVLFNEKPDYMSLKTFGCLCFPNLKPYNKHKLQFRSTPCILLGYSTYYKGYKCRDSTGRTLCQDM